MIPAQEDFIERQAGIRKRRVQNEHKGNFPLRLYGEWDEPDQVKKNNGALNHLFVDKKKVRVITTHEREKGLKNVI